MESVDFASGAGPSPAAVAAAAATLGLEPSGEETVQLAGLLGGAAAGPLARRIAAARPLGREYPFALALAPGEPLLTGVIDLLAEEPGGGRLLVDYKSDRVRPQDDLERLVESEYGVQRLLYALAALRTGAPRVEVVHWFLERPGEPAAALYEASDGARLERRLAALVRRARAGVYEVSPRPDRALCLTCPGRRELCSWGELQTLREHPRDPAEARPEDPGGRLRLF